MVSSTAEYFFKLFFADDFNAQLFRRALEYARSFDVPVAAHEEDLALSDGGAMHEGPVSTRIGLRGIPSTAEEVMVARDVLLAELTGGRLHLCHISTTIGLDLVRIAKRRNLAVSCEVAAHQFVLTDEDVAGASYDPNWKTNPPLRSAAEVESILQAVYDGTVDAIVSDHSPHHADEKEMDFAVAPAGIAGRRVAPVVADIMGLLPERLGTGGLRLPGAHRAVDTDRLGRGRRAGRDALHPGRHDHRLRRVAGLTATGQGSMASHPPRRRRRRSPRPARRGSRCRRSGGRGSSAP